MLIWHVHNFDYHNYHCANFNGNFLSKRLKKDKEKYLCKTSKLETLMANFLTEVVTTKLKFIPIVMIVALITWSAIQTKVLTPTAESAMPGIEIGINCSRAAFKYDSDANIDLRRLGEIMPGVISVNIPIQDKPEYFPMLPACTYDGTMVEGT